MAYNSSEILTVIDEMKQSFNRLYDDARFRWDLLHRRHGTVIEQELVKLGYPRVRSVVSPEVEYAARKVVGLLSAPQYEVHVEPHRDGDKTRADKLEVIDANLLLRIDPGDELSNATHRHQAVSPYAPWWVEKNPYNLPKKKPDETMDEYTDRVDKWRRTYTAFRVTVGDPLDTVFLEDGRLNVTFAAREVEIPLVDFVRDYGEYDRKSYAAGEEPEDLMTRVWDEQFANVRSGYGMAEGHGLFSGREKLKVCIADDGVKIKHYVIIPERYTVGGKAKEYRDIGEMSKDGGWDNPFGMPTLIVVPGVFDQTAIEPADRYQPLLLPLMQSRWNLDFTWSQWASKAAERPKYVAPLPPETQAQLMGMPPEDRAEYLSQLGELQDNRITPTFGKVDNLDAKQNAYEQQLYQAQAGEHGVYIPQSAFTGSEGSQGLMKNTPTSTLLRLDELESMDYEPAFRHKYNGFLKLLKMHDNFWTRRQSEKDAENRTVYAVTTGSERRQGKKTTRGIKAEFEAHEFEFPFDRSLHRIDNRVSTQMAALAALKERQTMPNGDAWVTDEEIAVALGKEDALEYMKQVRIETRYRRIQTAADSLTLSAALRRNALTLGISVQELLTNMSGAAPPPAAPPPAAPPPMGGGDAGGGVMQMAPPRRDPGAVGVEAGGGMA